MRRLNWRSGLPLATVVLALAACAPSKVWTEPSPALARYQIRSVVVLPFGRISTPQIFDKPLTPEFNVPRGAERSGIYVPVPPPSPDKQNFTMTIVPASAPERVTDMFYERLKRRGGLRVVSPDNATAARSADADPPESPEQAAAQTARQLHVDVAVLGRLLVYKEREGPKLAANSAAVGIEVKLIAQDGVTVWVGNYYEKQRPFVEDVKGFFEHGGVFVTADELAHYGADRLVREFPYGLPVQTE